MSADLAVVVATRPRDRSRPAHSGELFVCLLTQTTFSNSRLLLIGCKTRRGKRTCVSGTLEEEPMTADVVFPC